MAEELHKDVCNQQIFAKVYSDHAQEIRDFIYYKYGEQGQANDKMQDAFVKLWENCKKVSLKSARSFLYTVANNLVLNELKHQKVVLRHQQIKPKSHTSESPEYLMEHDQYLQQYQAALGRLTQEQRVAFALSKIEGKKHSEIAEMLGVTQKVVEYRIYSAFKQLKSELKDFKLK